MISMDRYSALFEEWVLLFLFFLFCFVLWSTYVGFIKHWHSTCLCSLKRLGCQHHVVFIGLDSTWVCKQHPANQVPDCPGEEGADPDNNLLINPHQNSWGLNNNRKNGVTASGSWNTFPQQGFSLYCRYSNAFRLLKVSWRARLGRKDIWNTKPSLLPSWPGHG